jgi:hypothetical protein
VVTVFNALESRFGPKVLDLKRLSSVLLTAPDPRDALNKALCEQLCALVAVRNDKDFRDLLEIDAHAYDYPTGEPGAVATPTYISFYKK